MSGHRTPKIAIRGGVIEWGVQCPPPSWGSSLLSGSGGPLNTKSSAIQSSTMRLHTTHCGTYYIYTILYTIYHTYYIHGYTLGFVPKFSLFASMKTQELRRGELRSEAFGKTARKLRKLVGGINTLLLEGKRRHQKNPTQRKHQKNRKTISICFAPPSPNQVGFREAAVHNFKKPSDRLQMVPPPPENILLC